MTYFLELEHKNPRYNKIVDIIKDTHACYPEEMIAVDFLEDDFFEKYAARDTLMKRECEVIENTRSRDKIIFKLTNWENWLWID